MEKMKAGDGVMQIYLPSRCMELPSGLLIGCWNDDKTSCCITGLVTQWTDMESLQQEILPNCVLGGWHNDTAVYVDLPVMEVPCNVQVVLRRIDAEMPTCKLSSSDIHPILILIEDMLASQYLVEKSFASQQKHMSPSLDLQRRDLSSKNPHSSDKTNASKNHIDFVISACISACHLQKKNGKGAYINNFAAAYIQNIPPLNANRDSSMQGNSWLTVFCHSELGRSWWPASIQQAQLKLSSARNIVTGQVASPLRWYNSLWKLVFDVAFGLVFMCLLSTTSGASLPNSVMQWTELVASQLKQLLHWMMGVPAGLKLNSPMAQCLGRFFLYHIYLWTGYLHLLHPFLDVARWVVAGAGLLGLSVQLSLLCDLVSLITLHIYCFYVYAARLYSLQLSCMGSLWRLFRGKKWNVLRQRVDSTSYDVDQLFIGTLFFTILLFLLPTTALFYSIHMALRMLVLSIQGLLHQLITVLNNLPVYLIYLRFFHPTSVADTVRLEVVKAPPGRPLCLSLQLVPASLLGLCREFWEQDSWGRYSWGDLAKMLLQGQLVYPWVESIATNLPSWIPAAKDHTQTAEAKHRKTN